MPATATKAPCCSQRSLKLKKANYAKAKKAAEAKKDAHTHMTPPKKKAPAKKAANKPAKPCRACGKGA